MLFRSAVSSWFSSADTAVSVGRRGGGGECAHTLMRPLRTIFTVTPPDVHHVGGNKGCVRLLMTSGVVGAAPDGPGTAVTGRAVDAVPMRQGAGPGADSVQLSRWSASGSFDTAPTRARDPRGTDAAGCRP